jgi:hypothetical protein
MGDPWDRDTGFRFILSQNELISKKDDKSGLMLGFGVF